MYFQLTLERPPSVSEIHPVHHDLPYDGDTDPAELVLAAAAGDRSAWDEIVRRYTPLLIGKLRSYRLKPADVEDVASTVWLRVIEHLGEMREPRALPKWMLTTASREALSVLGRTSRVELSDPQDPTWEARLVTPDEADRELLENERRLILLEAFALLSPRQRQVMLLLCQDPAASYEEISRITGMPKGAIGPTRARALERLREDPAVRALYPAADDPGPDGTSAGEDAAERSKGGHDD